VAIEMAHTVLSVVLEVQPEQTWCLNPGFATLFDETDRLMGAPQSEFTIPTSPLRVRADVDTFVKLAGGEYFFLPSVAALRYLAKLPMCRKQH
jgi:hypothetical protein